MRKAAQITGAVVMAAALMTGCGSGSGDGGKKAGDKSSAKPSEQPSTAAPKGGEKDAGKKDDAVSMNGMWNLQQDGEIFRVTIMGENGISDSPKGVCSGPAHRDGAALKLDLKCPRGDNPRTKGTVTLENGGKTLSVAWDNGPTEKYTKDPLKVEMPKIEMPKIDVPRIDIPSAAPAS
ncbi:hypothetical protein [Streptomyces sp. UNOB3_S3]|uniref:hypothetical protein n=1 Tax=Streptomyces sp. UNOB3_S3 TaxID=2871682 RepID=UPI001E4A81C3|nr:hypothetical protein [Streptomyces sp. UNOB3_S3]MCC3779291.1 hypothetical protein [Streptomyces sp. UNOB3_S3]